MGNNRSSEVNALLAHLGLIGVADDADDAQALRIAKGVVAARCDVQFSSDAELGVYMLSMKKLSNTCDKEKPVAKTIRNAIKALGGKM